MAGLPSRRDRRFSEEELQEGLPAAEGLMVM